MMTEQPSEERPIFNMILPKEWIGAPAQLRLFPPWAREQALEAAKSGDQVLAIAGSVATNAR